MQSNEIIQWQRRYVCGDATKHMTNEYVVDNIIEYNDNWPHVSSNVIEYND